MPPEYFDSDPDAPDKSYCDKMAVITDWEFDPVRFRTAPNTVRASDMTHWLALFTAEQAIANSGIDLETVDRSRVGVLLGNTLAGEFSRAHNLRLRWPYIERGIRNVLGDGTDAVIDAIEAALVDHLPEATEDTLSGNMSNTITGRICNHFNFGGGAFTVDGACSSSLLSIAIGCNALLDREMDLVIAGGVDISLDPFEIVGFAKTLAFTKDDIRPYDKRGAGMMNGEGCGIVMLARERDAIERGWNILARIRGWGYSSDGRGGITAPVKEGQARALRKAYQRAGYSPASVGYIEGHGTGTTLGDQVELSAIVSVLGEASRSPPCRIGSIKANIGHCKAAAGVAGLIKAVMSLHRGIIPPTLNCDLPNEAFFQAPGRLEPAVDGRPWTTNGNPRRASVSAMGFGGANSHLALEEADSAAIPNEDELHLIGSAQKTELLVLSAPSIAELSEKVARLLPVAERISMAEMTDLSATLLKRVPEGPYRLAVVAETPWALADALRAVDNGLSAGQSFAELDLPGQGIFAGEILASPKLAAVFPGQAAHRVDMGLDYYRRYPFLRELYADADIGLADLLPDVLTSYIFRDAVIRTEEQAKSWERALRDTRIAQPAIALTSVAILRVLREFGLEPEITLGHSLGKLAALHAAGAIDGETTVQLAAWRGDAMASLALEDNGAMAAVMASAKQVSDLIAQQSNDGLLISNYNAPTQTVISGPRSAVEAFVGFVKSAGLDAKCLPVSHAFHSEIVAPAAQTFRERMASIDFEPLRATYVSTHTGEPVAPHTDLRDLLAAAIRRPVNFQAAVEGAVAEKPTMWIEIGPGGILSGLLRQILGDEAKDIFTTDYPDTDGHTHINRIIARAFVQGFPVRLEKLFDHRYHKEGFDPDNYHPVFITNPCERPVEIPAACNALALPGLLPSEAVRPDFAQYLEIRGAFIRDIIRIDYQHHAGIASDNLPDVPVEAAVSTPEPATKQHSEPPGSLQDFVIEWIAHRTGFPTESIQPEMKLRDDLNLDSIKVGELAVEIGRFAGQRFGTDPSAYANASIATLVEHVDRAISERAAVADVSHKERAIVESVGSIAEWNRTFAMFEVPAPITDELALDLPQQGRAVVIGSETGGAEYVLDQLRVAGLTAEVAAIDTLISSGDSPPDLAVVVYTLPNYVEPISEIDAASANQRIEGTARDLFRLFKWIGHNRDVDNLNLRCVVVRPAHPSADMAQDMDAGAAMLKTLQFEYGLTGSMILKWITIPSLWAGKRKAEAILSELRHRSERVGFRYSLDGERRMIAAQPLSPDEKRTPLKLSPDDVFLVSGGAKGITCELALGLARKTGIKLALLGSSPRPAPDATTESSEIARNLARYAAEHIVVEYFEADVTDPDAVRIAANDAAKRLGPVTGILHGAGITEPRLFREMDEGSFLRCVRIKTTGFYNLLSAVNLDDLKAVHLVSSVLSKTGMRSQADYTYANAWLDGAASSLANRFPDVQMVTLGYTLWGETGLGLKLDSFKFLRKVGVSALSTEVGVNAFIDLIARPRQGTVFTITGRLPTELEAYLYAPHSITARPRYLERVLRHIPGTELVAEATLSHDTDLYLPEHIFEGTPMFPGVMAIEAMAQAAMQCTNRTEVPVFRNVRFLHPLIVPADAQVKVRVLALADPANEEGEIRVRAELRSEADAFQQNHFETECWFGVVEAVNLAQMTGLPDTLNLDPESFAPVPLFQGKLFRRIESVRVLDDGKRSLTDIRVPKGERYFEDAKWDRPVTGCPAILDSYLQSGTLILPPGCLPTSIARLHFLRQPMSAERVHCEIIVDGVQEGGFHVQITCRDTALSPVCLLRDLIVELPKAGQRRSATKAAALVAWEQLESDLRALLPDLRFGIASVTHPTVPEQPYEVSKSELQVIQEQFGGPRQRTALANLVAAKRALADFIDRHGGLSFDLHNVHVDHHPDGKPFFISKDESISGAVSSLCVTITDGTEVSLAMVSDQTIGIDLEPLEVRNTETWRALLGDDGYRLALKIQLESSESFDLAATRVWTLLEAGKKAAALKRLVPVYGRAHREYWHGFEASQEGMGLKHLCTCVTVAPDVSPTVFSLAEFAKPGAAPARDGATNQQSLPHQFHALTDRLSELQRKCASDPRTDRTEANHVEFMAIINNATEQVQAMECSTTPSSLPTLRKAFQEMLTPFLDGSVLFKRSLTKPLGYASDYLTLEMLAQNENEASGLGYHFDRWQLDDPASRAVRHRVDWVMKELLSFAQCKDKSITVLDLGAGAMPVERKLLRYASDIQWHFIGVDIEPQALEFCRENVQGKNVELETHCNDLTTTEGVELIAVLARNADVIVGSGILEALSDAQAIEIATTLRDSLSTESLIFLENFTDDNPNRIHMEWFMDFHLGYRSQNHLRRLLESAGFEPSQIEISTDPTGVLALAKVAQHTDFGVAKRRTPCSRAAPAHQEFDFGVTPDIWKAQVSTEEGSRPVAKFRFVVPFSDACSISRHVPFHKIMAWMGSIREAVNVGHGQALVDLFARGDWGLVTNEAEIVVHAEVSALSVVEVWAWSESMNDLRFVVQEVKDGIPKKVIAEGTQRFASVRIVDHGKVEPVSPPEFFNEFIKSLQAGEPPFRAPTDGEFRYLRPGHLLESWSYPMARTRILSQETFYPTTVESNVVGNVWYGNYFKWQAHVLDRLLARHVPEVFRDKGGSGELLVRRSRMTFFNEAMPMDRLEARLFLIELHEGGIKVGMEFHKEVLDSEPIKLSTAEIDAVWVTRDDAGVPTPAPLPSNLRHIYAQEQGVEMESDLSH
jgi:enediyne polyketide synthase